MKVTVNLNVKCPGTDQVPQVMGQVLARVQQNLE
jgi:hypothetical protein